MGHMNVLYQSYANLKKYFLDKDTEQLYMYFFNMT
jgi:hypothetical protein